MASRPRVVRIRGEDIELEEVLGVRAVRRESSAVPETAALVALYPSLSFEIEKFARAGWSFLTGEPPDSAQIFIRKGTRIWLAAGGVSLRFAPEIGGTEIDEALASEGLAITTRRARSLVRAAPVEGTNIDAIDAAARLGMRSGVLFAEPVFTEAIEQR